MGRRMWIPAWGQGQSRNRETFWEPDGLGKLVGVIRSRGPAVIVIKVTITAVLMMEKKE